MSTLKVEKIQHPNSASVALTLDTSGYLALQAGSASTPAIQGPSDPNTGIFFPAADTIAFAEGGTEVLRIDSSGRVGIGTSSPDALLKLSASSGGDTSGLRITRTDSGGGDWRIWVTATANGEGAGKLIFGNSGNRVTIDGSGNVGIGTTTPGDANEGAGLQVRNYIQRTQYYSPAGYYAGSFGYAGNALPNVWLAVDSNYNQGSAVSAGLFLSSFHGDATGGHCGYTIKDVRSGAALVFSRVVTANSVSVAATETERMRLHTTGGLSIGSTTSPSAVDPTKALRIGSLNVSTTTFSNVGSTWTDISVAPGANGLAFVDLYAEGSGTQGNFLVSWRGYPANATVISSNNGTGITINFQVSASKLQMQATTGAVSGSAFIFCG